MAEHEDGALVSGKPLEGSVELVPDVDLMLSIWVTRFVPATLISMISRLRYRFAAR